MRARVLSLLGVVLLSGCGVRGPKLPSLKNYRALPESEAANFLDEVRGAAVPLDAGRARYRVTARNDLGRDSGEQVVVFLRPDKLRLELFASSLNQLVMMIVARGDSLEALDAKEGVLYRGESTPANIARITGVPLRPEELMLWFAGLPLLSPLLEPKVLREPETGRYAVEGEIPYGRAIRARLEKNSAGVPRMLSLELRRVSDKKLFFYSEQQYGDGDWPVKIVFHLPEQDIRGELELLSARPNPDRLDDRLFLIPLRPGVEVEQLD